MCVCVCVKIEVIQRMILFIGELFANVNGFAFYIKPLLGHLNM